MTDLPIDDTILTALRNAPMPVYDGPEPDELSIARIQKYIEEGRFNELPTASKKWVCSRLMPSIVRFGCYPPPDDA